MLYQQYRRLLWVKIGLLVLLLQLVFFIGLANAAGQSTHPATEGEFVGYWRIILIDNDRHKSSIKNEQAGYTDPCQFFIHQSDGSWMNISPMIIGGEKATKDNCPKDRVEIDKHIAIARSLRPPFKWSKLSNQNGLFYVTDPAANTGLLWKADYVAEDLPAVERVGFELKKGDMVMQLTQRLGPSEIAPVWPMILRQVQSSAPVQAAECGFVDNKDGTVTDTRNGVIWKRCNEGLDLKNGTCIGTPIETSWNKAQLMAKQSHFLDKSDWRLPTEEEFKAVIGGYAKCKDSKFDSVERVTSILDGSGSLWTVSPNIVLLVLGALRIFSKDPLLLDNNSRLYVRLVRAGQ